MSENSVERRHSRWHSPQRPLVLVVDENADTRELYCTALATLEFDTDAVADISDVYPRAWSTHLVVVAVEIWPAGDRAWNVIHDIKRDPRTRHIPLVIVTSQGQRAARDRAAHEGCAAFLLKPCPPDVLATTLRDVLTVSVTTACRQPADGDTRPCPHCRNTLVFTSRYPVLTVAMALTRPRPEAGDGVRYERAWVCLNGGCDYRDLLGDA